MLGLGLLVRAEGPASAPALSPNSERDIHLADYSGVIHLRARSELDDLKEKLAAETARADKAEARAKAAEALLTPEQKAKLGN
jgi:hypothetical protein